ncbi:hypothetical protein ABFS82_10G071800 [Erythranthe guttata]|uniref:PUM-HD domain-containing protein n=1 Tax=Erythranthe guttata TaxID=4155 RepID=A0A022QGS2_ERYGU|nr:PREDICTED: pumilio homolog 6, chloroplastic [Erythranthe guttata]EYU25730.1 hypothetical protein MIMGU_mgv1a001529mg [Erythranthe guttata]|eukprot:XP_012851263.1 PREDICTED: pumilio homolog 6, chloroplastic [Erythranthe guttata]
MATESPIRIFEGTERWRNLKQSTNIYEPLYLKDQRFQQSFEKDDVIPCRSGSAPPNMEGSLAAIENMLSHRKLILDQRFGGPHSLSESRIVFQPSVGSGLASHEEESEDDQSSEKSGPHSVEKAALSGYNNSRSFESIQGGSYHLSTEEKFVTNISPVEGKVGIVTLAPKYKKDSDAVKDVDTANIEAVKSANAFTASNSETSNLYNNKDHLTPRNSVPHQQAAPQECTTSRLQGPHSSQIIYPYGNLNQSVSMAEVQTIHQFAPPLYANAAAYMTSATPFYPSQPPAGYFAPQYNYNSTVLPSYVPGYHHPHQSAVPVAFNNYDPQNVMKFYGQVGVPFQPPVHMQYFQPHVRGSYGGPANQVNYLDSKNRAEFLGGAAFNNSVNIKRGNMPSHYFLGSPTNAGPSVQIHHGGRYNTGLPHSSSGNVIKTNGQNQSWNNMTPISFLDELKSGQGRRFELSDITGHIVEFSVDQHGSRFIQQKLETCSVEEKASVFKEVVPHASKLIIDVFGNYVIQKLFEYGSPDQRKYLATQLEGQILPLSFQMYGCRVIQKALEVIEVEQKARLVRELDGHVLRCVRDQNGNHVIQKCIECIPTDRIHFVLSAFHGQVASLSMHPYGCRVIQRILERCNDDILTQFIVDEILDSVCSLAQDQYGNYVTQHVLERGKPLERSEIIRKLAGSVVQLSQHKFASNVVEKCLEYSDSTTRGMLLKEIIGHGEKNDNLLVMMKDQYANYVIQKILEKCSSDQREVLLGLIRNHLTALKKYTYGKHIVARFEQLYGEDLGCDCSSPKIKPPEIDT